MEAPGALKFVKMADVRVFLIGGTSHTGKSTLANALAAQLGWIARSTDFLARHPGRPWKMPPQVVPPHVVEHYRSLPVPDLIADVLRHYRQNVWPQIESMVRAHATDLSSDHLILEGSAVLPERVATLSYENVAAIWLIASHELLARRIYAESQYTKKSPAEQELIDKFIQRTWAYNDLMREEVQRLGFACLVEDAKTSPEDLLAACRSFLRS